MEANVLDLRYHMKKILQALDRKEKITILYHGKIKGILMPAQKESARKIERHPLFGMESKSKISVLKQLENLRGGRYDDL